MLNIMINFIAMDESNEVNMALKDLNQSNYNSHIPLLLECLMNMKISNINSNEVYEIIKCH